MFDNQKDLLGNLANDIHNMKDIDEQIKSKLLKNIQNMRNIKTNILITGATGCGKSSTINALFGDDIAKVGQGVRPETMDIQKFDLNNLILWDSPGLGDGKEADNRHAKNIIEKLYEKDAEGNALIDLVLVILDGSSRDLGTSYELINKVIIPNLGEDTSRLLVAINQCDMAMKGRYWNHETNQPEQPLIDFLEEKITSTRNRIREATGVTVEPIYYSAGYKDGDEEQRPYNLSKLLMFIIKHTPEEKRVVYSSKINDDENMWIDDDGEENYGEQIKENLGVSVMKGVSAGVTTGAALGGMFGGPVGAAIGATVGAAIGGILSLFGR